MNTIMWLGIPLTAWLMVAAAAFVAGALGGVAAHALISRRNTRKLPPVSVNATIASGEAAAKLGEPAAPDKPAESDGAAIQPARMRRHDSASAWGRRSRDEQSYNGR